MRKRGYNNTAKLFVFDTGFEYTNDIFILPGILYYRVVWSTEQLEGPNHRVIYSNKYYCINYGKGLGKTEITACLYYNEFRQFMKLRDVEENFMDTVIQDIINYDLISFTLSSEYLFNR